MMGCALNLRTQLMMNTGWHVTSAICGTSCIDLDKIPGPDDAWIGSVCSDI